MRLWLDDVRDPEKREYFGVNDEVHLPSMNWVWVKTYEQAIAALETGEVTCASLDHDLDFACPDCERAFEKMRKEGGKYHGFQNGYVWDDRHWEPYLVCNHKNGYDVVRWMDKHNVWPAQGVRIHSANARGAARMKQLVDAHYNALRTDGDGI